eukprot:29273-Pelagomonas_calceolata.AAC.1
MKDSISGHDRTARGPRDVKLTPGPLKQGHIVKGTALHLDRCNKMGLVIICTFLHPSSRQDDVNRVAGCSGLLCASFKKGVISIMHLNCTDAGACMDGLACSKGPCVIINQDLGFPVFACKCALIGLALLAVDENDGARVWTERLAAAGLVYDEEEEEWEENVDDDEDLDEDEDGRLLNGMTMYLKLRSMMKTWMKRKTVGFGWHQYAGELDKGFGFDRGLASNKGSGWH